MQEGKKVVITYGTFDLLHFGHIRLLERAKQLGDILIVGVTSESFDRDRGKLNVYQPLSDRMNAVLQTGIADRVIVEEFQGQKVSDIRKYGVDIFAIGSDWEGKFDFLNKYCEVVYLDRTTGVSSTELRANRVQQTIIGCIGVNKTTERMVRESMHVASVSITNLCVLSGETDQGLSQRYGLSVEHRVRSVLEAVDAVFVSTAIDKRADIVNEALEAGRHVLCDGSVALSRAEGSALYEKARDKGLVLMEANKTLYYPAFEHLRLLVASGIIGEVKDIRAANSHVDDQVGFVDVYKGGFYNLAPFITLPALVFLGNDYRDARLSCQFEGEFCTWAKLDLVYDSATATLCAGQGVKTENDLVVTGTNGYVYVPSPWWKTEYFEVRGEDLRDTRKYYYECVGDGLRYELFEFIRRVSEGDGGQPPIRSEEDSLAVIDLIEKFHKGDYFKLNHGKFSFGGGERITDR